MTKLSERMRPDVEVAPWVLAEIKKLEKVCASKQQEIDSWKIVAEDWRVKAVEWSRKNAMEGLK